MNPYYKVIVFKDNRIDVATCGHISEEWIKENNVKHIVTLSEHITLRDLIIWRSFGYRKNCFIVKPKHTSERIRRKEIRDRKHFLKMIKNGYPLLPKRNKKLKEGD